MQGLRLLECTGSRGEICPLSKWLSWRKAVIAPFLVLANFLSLPNVSLPDWPTLGQHLNGTCLDTQWIRIWDLGLSPITHIATKLKKNLNCDTLKKSDCDNTSTKRISAIWVSGALLNNQYSNKTKKKLKLWHFYKKSGCDNTSTKGISAILTINASKWRPSARTWQLSINATFSLLEAPLD